MQGGGVIVGFYGTRCSPKGSSCAPLDPRLDPLLLYRVLVIKMIYYNLFLKCNKSTHIVSKKGSESPMAIMKKHKPGWTFLVIG